MPESLLQNQVEWPAEGGLRAFTEAAGAEREAAGRKGERHQGRGDAPADVENVR
jgi:hypothetical protein